MPQGRGSSRKKNKRRPRRPNGHREPMLYHGTTASLAGRIEADGLVPGLDGRVYFTDSLDMAQRYATWAAALASTIPGSALTLAGSKVGAEALALGGQVAVVAHIPRRNLGKLSTEANSTSPPLPWETTVGSGTTYFTENPIPSDRIDGYQVFRVEELDDVAPEAITAESERIARTFRRDNVNPMNFAPKSRSALTDQVPNLGDLLTDSFGNRAGSSWHGTDHALEVAGAAVRILEAGAEADPAVLLAFAVLHDSQRASEGRDPDHGQRAADYALTTDLLNMDDGQLDLLTAALISHDRGETSTDPTIGACWDADRLTLPRVGITPDPDLLSTPQGRTLIGTELPTAETTDWSWIYFRLQVLDVDQPSPAGVA